MQRILDFIIGAGILQGIFLASYLWIAKKKDHSSKALSLLLGTLSVNLIHSLFRKSMPMLSGAGSVIEPFQLLFAPLFYMFVRARTTGKSWEWKDAFHFLPFLLVITALTAHSIINIQSIKPAAGLLFWGLVLIQIVIYIIFCGLLVKNYNRSIADIYSEIEKRKLNWLHYFMGIILVIYIGYFFMFSILIHQGDTSHFEALLSILQTLAILGLGYMALFQESGEIPPSVNDTSKYVKSGLPKDELVRLSGDLSELMETQKPYLDPELSLPQLAELAGIPRNTVSQIINEGFGKNYFDYINGYRIDEFIRLLGDPKKQHLKILALALEAGFNSKPAFNSIFKKSTGFTPSGYRKKFNSLP